MLGAAFLTVAPSVAGALNYGNFGSVIDSTSAKDYVPTLTEPATADLCIGYVQDPANPTDTSRRAWFFHVDATGGCDDTQVLSSRSYRYTLFAGTTSTNWMGSSDTTYVGKTFNLLQDLDANGAVCWSEADGIPGFSLGDPVYYDADGDAQLSTDDFRMAAVSTSENAPFTTSIGIVKATDTDLETAEDDSDDPTERPISENFSGNSGACGGFDAKALDLGAQGTFESTDVFYLTHGNLPTATFGAQGILRLTSISGLTAGKKIVNANNDHRDFLETVDTNDADNANGLCDATCAYQVVRTNPGETDIGSQNLFLHAPDPGSSDNDILINDLVLRNNQASETSAGSPGQLVTSTSSGVGTEILDASDYSLQDLIFFVDLDGDGNWDPDDTPGEPVYMKHPSNNILGVDDADCHGNAPAGNQRCLQLNDLRVWVPSKTAGSLVQAGDSDFSANKDEDGLATSNIKIFREKLDSRTPLKTVSQGKFWDKDDDNVWDPATEDVFIGAMTNDSDATTYKQVWTGGAAVDNGVTCPALGNPCGGSNLQTTSDVMVTGPDTSWDGNSESEYVYWSEDSSLTVGDYRLGDTGSLPGGVVASGDAALGLTLLQSTGVTLYASFTNSNFPSSRDIKLYPSFGTRLTSTSTEVVPDLSQIDLTTALELVRLNLGQASTINEDVYILDFSDGTCNAAQMLRMTPHSGGAAGTFLDDTDTVETSNCQTSGTKDTDLSNAFGYLESGTTTGFSSDDFLYVNNADLGGTAGTTLNQWDSRLNKITFSGTTYNAGTFVNAGDKDHQTFAGDGFDGTTFRMFHYDANRNGIVDKDDMVYLRQGTDVTLTPRFLDMRLIGGGGATSSTGGSGGGGGGGGGGTTTTPPSISISQPTSGTYVTPGSTVSISGTASGGSSYSVSSVSVTVNGQSQTVTGTSSWSTSYTPSADGSYSISATVTNTGGQTASASRTFNVNEFGEATQTCPNGDVIPASDQCPSDTVVDEQAREDAEEAKQSAEEAKQSAQEAKTAAENAQQTAQEARDAAKSALNTTQGNSDKLDEVIESLNNQNGAPGPGLLGVLAALAVALVARARRHGE